MKIISGKRGSGKTSALLYQAIKNASQGAEVLFITPTAQETKRIEGFLKETNQIDNILVMPAALIPINFRYLHYDIVYIDEVDICMNMMFNNKVDAISIGEDSNE